MILDALFGVIIWLLKIPTYLLGSLHLPAFTNDLADWININIMVWKPLLPITTILFLLGCTIVIISAYIFYKFILMIIFYIRGGHYENL